MKKDDLFKHCIDYASFCDDCPFNGTKALCAVANHFFEYDINSDFNFIQILDLINKEYWDVKEKIFILEFGGKDEKDKIQNR